MTTKADTRRVFLVGCPRSGTTLLQSLLFAHPQVISFPETFFFVHVANERGWRRRIGLAKPQSGRAITTIREMVGDDSVSRRRRPLTIAGHADQFVRSLDATAQRAGATAWVEKTPSHLHRVGVIEQYVRSARFVHIVRDAWAAVASLHKVTHEHPGRRTRSVRTC